jgi:hypothetical protein
MYTSAAMAEAQALEVAQLEAEMKVVVAALAKAAWKTPSQRPRMPRPWAGLATASARQELEDAHARVPRRVPSRTSSLSPGRNDDLRDAFTVRAGGVGNSLARAAFKELVLQLLSEADVNADLHHRRIWKYLGFELGTRRDRLCLLLPYGRAPSVGSLR